MTKTILVTPGEFKGVGLEVFLKAFLKNPFPQYTFLVYSERDYFMEHVKKFASQIKYEFIDQPSTSFNPGLYVIDSNKSPVDWFKDAAEFCNQNSLNTALVTGPLTKASFKDQKCLGHTEYLRQTYPGHDLFMTFFGNHYNCLLLNDHIPISRVTDQISYAQISNAIKLILPMANGKKIGLLGLNPHAGENGLIGPTEDHVHKKIVDDFKGLVEGPLPADGFFSLDSYKKYSFLIANYHDQGLIPFKLIHSFEAAQASLGLPFIRTSVDHGTAENIFMDSVADESSMVYAIQLAEKLLDLRKEG